MLSAYELAEAFPNEGELAKKRIKELSSRLKEWEILIDEIIHSKVSDDNKKAYLIITKNFMAKDDRLKEYETLKKYLELLKKPVEERTGLDVAAAKRFPIQNLFIPEHARETAKRITCRCPLHEDTKPSFVIYKETNSFFCFSSCGGGDSIAFAQKLFKLSFIDAVKKLGG